MKKRAIDFSSILGASGLPPKSQPGTPQGSRSQAGLVGSGLEQYLTDMQHGESASPAHSALLDSVSKAPRSPVGDYHREPPESRSGKGRKLPMPAFKRL